MAAITGSIKGHEDFELGVPRTVPVTYVAEVPETDRADGLVFLIPGFGGDKDEALMTLTRRHIAAKYNLVVVSVRAHCHFCRMSQSTPEMPVQLEIDPWSLAKAIGALVLQGDGLEGLSSAENAEVVKFLKSRSDHKFELNGTMVPPGDDYQNFGVLAALDHLKVLGHLGRDDELDFDRCNVILAGTSHGAYIAHLMHKFAPNTISAIIDSSSYSETVPTYLGFGGVEVRIPNDNIEYILSTKTAWSTEVIGAPNYFGIDEANLRHLGHPGHMKTVDDATLGVKCQFRMIHSVGDRLVNIDLKRRHVRCLSDHGYDVVLDEATQADVDGSFITTLEHGMGIALNKLFDRYYPTLSRSSGPDDRKLGTCLEFEGINKAYRVDYGGEIGAPIASRETLGTPMRVSDILSA